MMVTISNLSKRVLRSLLIGAWLLLLSSCTEQITEVNRIYYNGCPDFTTMPLYTHAGQRVSFDGKKVAYMINEADRYFYILDIQSLYVTKIDLMTLLPHRASDYTECSSLVWAPYTSDKIAVYTVGGYDSSGSRLYKKNAYIYTISTSTIKRITPPGNGVYGANDIVFHQWLKGSNENIDSFAMNYGGVYVPQKDSVYHPNSLLNEIIYQSPVSSDKIILSRRDEEVIYEFNGVEIPFMKYVSNLFRPSWSPDGKRIVFAATSVLPRYGEVDDTTNTNGSSGGKIYEELWVFSIDKFKHYGSGSESLYVYRLNIQQLHCMYSPWGINPQFISDSTFVVSLCKDGDYFCGLWEMNLRGDLVRQLTFTP